MKLGFLSDIHANAVALEEVLSHKELRNVDFIFCAGDIVGYYPEPNETVEIIRGIGASSIRGNHDEAVITSAPKNYNIDAKRSIDWTRRNLSKQNIDYLSSLPDRLRINQDGIDISMVHGSPQNPLTEYIWEESVDEKFIRYAFDEPPDIAILGHTHVPFVKKVGDTLILNPGSVGQPRDSDPRASFAVFDSNDMTAKIHRVKYDIEKIAISTSEILPKKLGERLYAGR